MVKSKQEIITQDIALKIKHQLYKPGDYLPSENQLAELYGAARNTVRKSLGEIVVVMPFLFLGLLLLRN